MINNTPIFITGCQRSGTTLLHLILDSHPQIRGLDEWEVQEALFDQFLTDPQYHPCVAFKLPKVAHLAPALRCIPGVKMLWCVRDPRDVVTSMLKLKQKKGAGTRDQVLWSLQYPVKALKTLLTAKSLPVALSWASISAVPEIQNTVTALHQRKVFPDDLAEREEQFRQISQKHPLRRSHADQVLLGAFCWRVKQEMFHACCQGKDEFHVVRYEPLVQQPQAEITKILEFLNLPWRDDVLRHHTLHAGVSVGQTENTRPIDSANREKWKGFLSDEDLAIIKQVCGARLSEFYA